MNQDPQKSDQSVDQLDRRSKELDAREHYLISRETLAEDTEVLIAKQQRELALLDSTIVAREVILKGQQAQMAALDKESIQKGTKLQRSFEQSQAKLFTTQDYVSLAQVELKDIRIAIDDRKAYYQTQEDLITNQAVEGNTHLKSLDYEVTSATQVIRDLEVKKKSLKATIDDLTVDLEEARQSFLPELEKHEQGLTQIAERKVVMQDELAELDKQFNEKSNQLSKLNIRCQQVDQEITSKLLLLDAKEREIMAKREALRVEREEMDEARHYYKNPKSLYGTI